MVVNFAMEGKEYTSDYLFSSLFFQKMTSYDRNLWLAASNAENGVDWLWMGTGKDGKDVPLHYNSWALNEPRKKGMVIISNRRSFNYSNWFVDEPWKERNLVKRKYRRGAFVTVIM